MQSHLAVQSLDGDILELQNGERPCHVAHCILALILTTISTNCRMLVKQLYMASVEFV